MRTFTLELRVDFDNEDQYETVKQQLLESGRQIYAVALLISGKRQPQIALHSTDFFHGNEDFDITEGVES